MDIAVLADDLTGACDAGVQFARAGYRTEVGFGPPPHLPEHGALVIDTDSRVRSPAEAAGRVLTAAQSVRSARLVYKKLDSTLRGHVAAELAAALAGSGRERGVYAPAFPQYGRTTRGGVQLVDTVPVHGTAFAHDPRNPMRESHIPTLLKQGGLSGVAVLSTDDLRDPGRAWSTIARHTWTVVDIDTEADLRALIRTVPDPGTVLWGGSTGLARALGEALPAARPSTPNPASPARRVLTVVGSVNMVSRAQLAQLLAAGVVSVSLDAALGEGDGVARAVSLAGQALKDGSSVALSSTLPDEREREEAAARVAAGLAAVVQALSRSPGFDALVLTGGDTAVHVARALGATGLTLEREVEPGIPLGRLTGPLAVPAVTKAGGFGSPDALVHALRALQHPEEMTA